jgi:hypothetical protein
MNVRHYLKGCGEIRNPLVINSEKIPSDGRTSSGTIYDFVAAHHRCLKGRGISHIPYHDLH